MNKYEFYKRGNVLNLKGVIKKFADDFKIDASSERQSWQGIWERLVTNRSFRQRIPYRHYRAFPKDRLTAAQIIWKHT